MTRTATLAFLVSTALAAGAGIALASMPGTGQSQAPAPGKKASTGAGRSNRFMAQFDLNGDGRVTRDEMNKALGHTFAQSSAGGGMNLEQFAASRKDDFRKRSDQMFHRIDWNGDGKLSLDEFAAEERARFMAMDRKGSGQIFCSRRGGPAKGAASSRGNARASFCAEYDLNKDGRIGRGEFDKVTAQRFAAAAKGGAMTIDAYYSITVVRFQQSAQRTFARLDANHDGKLSLAEFAAPEQKMFARADRNSDGAVTRDETSKRRGYASRKAG